MVELAIWIVSLFVIVAAALLIIGIILLWWKYIWPVLVGVGVIAAGTLMYYGNF